MCTKNDTWRFMYPSMLLTCEKLSHHREVNKRERLKNKYWIVKSVELMRQQNQGDEKKSEGNEKKEETVNDLETQERASASLLLLLFVVVHACPNH